MIIKGMFRKEDHRNANENTWKKKNWWKRRRKVEKPECNRGREEEKEKGEREVKRKATMQSWKEYSRNHCARHSPAHQTNVLHKGPVRRILNIFSHVLDIHHWLYVCMCVCEREDWVDGGKARCSSQRLPRNSTSHGFDQSGLSECLRDLFYYNNYQLGLWHQAQCSISLNFNPFTYNRGIMMNLSWNLCETEIS